LRKTSTENLSKISYEPTQATHLMIPAQLVGFIPKSMKGQMKGLMVLPKDKNLVYLPLALANHVKGLNLSWVS